MIYFVINPSRSFTTRGTWTSCQSRPELYGGIELWFKDMECARQGVGKLLGHNPDVIDAFAEKVVDLRRAFITEEKVVFEEK